MFPPERNTSVIKFADSPTVSGLLTGAEEVAYSEEVAQLGRCCQENKLSLNTEKTKEMIIDEDEEECSTTYQLDSGGPSNSSAPTS